MAPTRRDPNPWLNLFWLVLFAPVAWILARIWKHDLPWMGEEKRPNR